VAGPVGAAVPPPAAGADALAPPDEGAEVAPDDVAEDELDGVAEAAVVPVAVVDVVEADWVEVETTAALASPEVGTVSGGAPEVSAREAELLPPQAASPRAARMPESSAASVAIERLMGVREDARSPRAPYACHSAGSR
jgi:hypothetical protein